MFWTYAANLEKNTHAWVFLSKFAPMHPKCDFNKVAKQETPMATSKTQTLDPTAVPGP